MKKPIAKLLATCLVFILLVSVAPISAFAATDAQSAKVACTHPLCYAAMSGRYESCGSAEYHNYYEIELSICGSCGMSFETILSVSQEAHIVEVWNLISYNENYFFYEGECKYCGEELVLTLSRG